MNLLTILMFATLLQVSAHSGAQTVTVTSRQMTLPVLFDAIRQQAGYEFLYSPKALESARPFAIDVKNATVSTVLSIGFKNQPFSYEIIEKTIVIRAAETNDGNTDPRSASPMLEIPPITVRGRIINENGEPVIASVTIKGTNKGTTSNANGEFELINIEDDAELIITSASTESITVKVNNRSSITISVKSAVSDLDAVVVNKGYYTESRKLSTGNVSRVDAKTIEKQPISNPLQAVQGRMAGVYVQQQGGVPGGGFSILIRGRNSLRPNGNEPLYIVDGVPFTSNSLSSGAAAGGIILASPLNAINPNDIESLQVLKDADATAIYGSRGANGVVLINTKKGRPGKTKFDINVYKGVAEVGKNMDLLNREQYLEMRIEALKNDDYLQYLLPQFASFFKDLLVWDTTRNTDWQKELIGGKSQVTNAQFSFSGGNNNTQFLFGGGFYKEGTVFPGEFADQKFSGHFSLNHSSDNKKLGIQLQASYLNDNNRLPQTDLTYQALILPPTAPKLYGDDGKLNWENNTWSNPLQQILRNYQGTTDNLVTNALLSYEVFNGLFLKTSLGYTKTQMQELSLTPIASLNPFSEINTGSAVFANKNIKTWIVEPQAEYKKSFKNSRLNVLLGMTFQENLTSGQALQADGYTSDALLENINASGDLSSLDATYIQYKYNAFFGRVNYIHSDKYLINITGRRDGSSRFGPDKRFANFGAIGLGWIFSTENFINNNLPFLSFGKLRGSYGTTGNDQIDDYQYLDTYSPATYSYQGNNGLIPTQLSNKEYAWESNKKLEAGIELGFMNDRFFVSANYYQNRSSNQLVGYALPPTAGFPDVIFNLPATVQNTGWEFELRAGIIQRKNFRWITNINFTAPKNKLLSYPNLGGSSNATTFIVGKSVFIYNAIHGTGVDSETGVYMFEDFDKNGNTFDIPGDFQGKKEIAQNYYGGLNNSLSFRNFQLDFLFQFVKQTGRNYLNVFDSPAGFPTNQPAEVMNRWQKPGDITNIQAFTQLTSSLQYQAFSNARFYSDNVLSDASFIRLKNLSFSWSLPQKLSKPFSLQSARLYAQAQNLVTFSNYIGLDPESQSAGLPPLRVYTIGIQLTF